MAASTLRTCMGLDPKSVRSSGSLNPMTQGIRERERVDMFMLPETHVGASHIMLQFLTTQLNP